MAFGKKWDKNGEFIRKYVPELKMYGEKYIYEPWKASLADQRAWGCLVKGDGSGKKQERDSECEVYPKPMFDFAERREVCLEGMKKAYEVGLYGDDKRVLDGSWKELFEGEGDVGLDVGEEMGLEDLDLDDLKVYDADGDDGVDKAKSSKSGVTRKRGVSKSQGTLDGIVVRGKTKKRKVEDEE